MKKHKAPPSKHNRALPILTTAQGFANIVFETVTIPRKFTNLRIKRKALAGSSLYANIITGVY
jgi:hypothetical protein